MFVPDFSQSKDLILELIEKFHLALLAVRFDDAHGDFTVPMRSVETQHRLAVDSRRIRTYFIKVPDERRTSSIIFILSKTMTQSCSDVAS